MGSESGGVQNEVLACGGGRRAPRIRPPPRRRRRLRHIMKTTCTSGGGFQSRSALCSTVTGCAGHVQSSPNRAISPVSGWWSITPSAAGQGWSLPGAPGDCSSCVRSLQPSCKLCLHCAGRSSSSHSDPRHQKAHDQPSTTLSAKLRLIGARHSCSHQVRDHLQAS